MSLIVKDINYFFRCSNRNNKQININKEFIRLLKEVPHKKKKNEKNTQ